MNWCRSIRRFYCSTKNVEKPVLNLYQKPWFNSTAYSTDNPKPLRSKKKKSSHRFARDFIDSRLIRTSAGDGGEGCLSFLQLFANDRAGPDGGDGGNGGHVIIEANSNVHGLDHVKSVIEAEDGEKGYGKNCHGRNSRHTIVKVPVGTIIKNHVGRVVADLYDDGMMFLAARGGAGGKGNTFFASDLEPSPKIAELGAEGENNVYTLELSSMAHFGLLGFPNAGKSTLLQAVTRANPKVAPYPFTTLKPHLGVLQYSDLEQITIADLPGLIEGSHKNRGLGITFLRHAERCLGLLILLDMSDSRPWENLRILRHEVLCFSPALCERPQIIVANKMDISGSEETLKELKRQLRNEVIIPISAKHGKNLSKLLSEIRIIYNLQISRRARQLHKDQTAASHLPLA